MSRTPGWWAPIGLCLVFSASAAADELKRTVPEFFAAGDDVRDALLVLAEDIGFNLVVSPRVHGPVLASLRDVPLPVLLDAVLASVNATWVDENSVVQVMTEREYELRYPERVRLVTRTFSAGPEGVERLARRIRQLDPKVQAIADAPPEGVVVRTTVARMRRLEEALGRPARSALDRYVDDFIAAGDNVQDVMAILGQDLGLRIVVSPNVKGAVSASLQDVTLRQILDTVVPQLGAVYVEENGIIQVMTEEEYFDCHPS